MNPEFESLLKEAVTAARASRGQDDSSNDWFSESAAGVASKAEHDCMEFDGYEDYAHQDHENYEEDYEVDDPRDECIPHEDARKRFMDCDSSDGIFTLLVKDEITEEVEYRLDQQGMDQHIADAGDEAGVTTLLDDSLFEDAFGKIEGQ